jgi:hypothetical protein
VVWEARSASARDSETPNTTAVMPNTGQSG